MSELKDFETRIAKLKDRMNRAFNNLSSGIEPLDKTEWMPTLDVLENKDDIVVKVDIPGVDPNEIDLSISGDTLYIKGERKREVGREDENYHTIERGYGRFSRKVILPTSVNIENIKASYKDGVLVVRLPKLEKKKSAEIRIALK